MEILENISRNQFLISFFLGWSLVSINEIIFAFINYIQDKGWRCIKYEKIIYKYMDLYTSEDKEEIELIASIYNKFDKRKRSRGRFKKIFIIKD